MAKSKGRRLAEWLRNLDSNSKASSDTLADDSVSTAKLQTDAVTNPKIADGAIHTANLADANVTFAKLHTALVVTESDAISSNDNDTTVPTSAAVIDYVATQIATKDNSDEITEGSTNLYFTNARARAAISENSTQLAYDSSTGILTFTQGNTDTVSEGSTNLYYTDARVASYLSANGYGTSSSIIASITDSAPTTLDTLNELAAALGDDANFSTTVTNSIGTKWTQDNTKISNWDTAYGWGNHASAGYLTSYTETDNLNSVTGRGATTTNAVGTGKITVTTSQQNGLEVDGSHSNGSYLYINGPVGNTWFGQNGSGLAAIWSDGSTQALTLAASTGNATFSGSVTATGATFTGDIIANGLEVGTAYGSDSQYLGIKRSAASSNDYILIQGSSSDAGSTYLTAGSGKNVHIRASSNNTTNQLVVTTSGTTIGGNTVWHAGNDGSGSGLDADTLDGVQGSSYLRSDAADTATGVITFDGGSTSSFGPIITSSSAGGPAVKIKSTATNGNDWWIISNNSSNTDGAGRLQLWNNTGGFTAATIGASASTTSNLYTPLNITGNVTVSSGSLFLPAGYNLQWGAGYNSGKSTIWSDGTANIIRMAPTGNSSGKTLELTATATNTFRSLLIDSNWGAGTYSEALTVYGTYPSYAFRSTTSSTTFLQHLDSAGHLTWYFDTTGNTGTSWNMKAKLTSAGVLTIGSSGSDTVWSSGNDGSGSGLDADLLDGQHASAFASSSHVHGRLYAESGTTSNYLSLASTNELELFNSSGVIQDLYLNYSGGSTSLKGPGGGTIWHAGNDGSGSGLDADTVDGFQVNSSATNNQANVLVRTQANGYIHAGWINSVSGSSGTTNRLTRITASYDAYLRYLDPASFKVQIGESYKNTYSRSVDYGTDSNYWVGSFGHASYDANQTFHAGSGFFDIWSGSNYPSGTSHIHGFNALHYTTGSISGNTGTAYGWQMAAQYNLDTGPWWRRCSAGSFTAWRKIWHDSNDGSGSGLDADTVDGYNTTQSGGAGLIAVFNAANGYLYTNNWVYLGTGQTGIYSGLNSAHWYPNAGSTYGTWRMNGSRNSYGGFWCDYSAVNTGMHDSAGNGGTYRQANGRWYWYHHVGNNCTGFSTSTTSSSYTIYSDGAIYSTGNITAYSDRRVKENIIQIDSALDKVNKLEGVYYNKIDDETKTKEIGFIAQDVQEAVPELVTYAEDIDEYGVKYGNATALLVEAVKELTQQVNTLKKELEELKNA